MKFEKSLKKTVKLARAERDILVDRLERLDDFINAAADGRRRTPKIQRRSKHHRKPMSKATRRKIGIARKKAWAKKGKQAEAAAA